MYGDISFELELDVNSLYCKLEEAKKEASSSESESISDSLEIKGKKTKETIKKKRIHLNTYIDFINSSEVFESETSIDSFGRSISIN